MISTRQRVLFLLSVILATGYHIESFSTSPLTTRRLVHSVETKSKCWTQPMKRSTEQDDNKMTNESKPNVHHSHHHQQQQQHHQQQPLSRRNSQTAASLAAASIVAMATTCLSSPILPANAYVPSDYASDTVQAAVQELQTAAGNVDATFKAYENIAGIITEGKGVGGMVNYKGVSLDRGYVADEDTSIYNPGLTLLTESEKERLVEAVIDARKAGLSQNQWSENNEFAFEFLREKLDPFHLVELSGFLNIVPFYAGILYLGVLAVQQMARESFQVAYLVGVALFFLPIVALVAAGV